VTSVSVVVTLERTYLFHIDFVLSTRVESVVLGGISFSTDWHACAEEMKDMPTLDVTFEVEKLNVAPTLSPVV